MVIETARKLCRAAHDQLFRQVHGGRLIYNTSWEDPRIDRELLQLNGASKVVMITSAGCNALDYLLDGPARIESVDVNYRQNALAELKIALIRHGSYEDLFRMFGQGRHPGAFRLWRRIRHRMPGYAREYWDRNLRFFNGRGLRKSFYFHGTSGEAAWILRKLLLGVKRGIRPHLDRMLAARTLEEQRSVYHQAEPILWDRLLSWVISRPATMAMMGVPRPQIRLIDEHCDGGLAGFVKDKFRRVMTEIDINSNYFWRVYLTGSYSADCCPGYLKAANFQALRAYVSRLRLHTCSVTDFLRDNPGEYTHFVLLDHQDWLASHDTDALQEEWDSIFDNASPGAKVLMRSAGLDTSFLPPAVRSRLRFHPRLTEKLHLQDRVGTYGSLHLAEIR